MAQRVGTQPARSGRLGSEVEADTRATLRRERPNAPAKEASPASSKGFASLLRLMKVGADLGELAAQTGAESGQGADDEDGDQRSEQCVFDRGRARLVGDEDEEGLDHDFAPA